MIPEVMNLHTILFTENVNYALRQMHIKMFNANRKLVKRSETDCPIYIFETEVRERICVKL